MVESQSRSDATMGARLMFREMLTPPIGRASGMRVELDKKSLFALASDTRLDILRSLQPMRRTVTQLSETLSIDKAAIHRHLKKLEDGGLVKRYEDHGFVYYGLSWKARDLLSPNENTRIIVLLSSSWVFILIAIFLVIATLGSGFNATYGGSNGANYSQTGESRDVFPTAESVPWIIWALPAVGFALIGAMLVILASRSLIKPKQKGASAEVVASDQQSRLDD